MNSSVDIGVDLFVVIPRGFKDTEGFLRSSRIIKINERFPINLLTENRKVRPNLIRINCTHTLSVIPRELSRKRWCLYYCFKVLDCHREWGRYCGIALSPLRLEILRFALEGGSEVCRGFMRFFSVERESGVTLVCEVLV